MNKLYFGDNLDILREHIAAEEGSTEREKAAMGFFVMLAEPTRPMKEEAVSAGFYDAPRFGSEYPKLQILTIEGLMSGTECPRYPDLTLGRLAFKRAAVNDMEAEQGELL